MATTKTIAKANGAANKRTNDKTNGKANGKANGAANASKIARVAAPIQDAVGQNWSVKGRTGKNELTPERLALKVAAMGAVRGEPRACAPILGSPKFKIVNVTPAIAAEWLERNVDNNRQISAGSVAQYARDMAAGNWRFTPEPIIFNEADELVNGQHRLHAVIISGATVSMTVATGFALNFDDPLDQGRTRTLAQLLHADNRWVAFVRSIDGLEKGNIVKRQRMSLAEVQSTYAKHEKYIDLLWPEFRQLFGPVLGAIAWALPLDQKLVLKFATDVRDGEMLKKGSPAYALRGWFPRNARASSYQIAFATCNALRAVLLGESLGNVFTGSTGYRWLCTKRRTAKIPHTPNADTVPSLSDSVASSTGSTERSRAFRARKTGGDPRQLELAEE